jgi:hypothetical protein
MVIARSVKLLSLFSLIFSSGLCFRVLLLVVCSQLVVERSHHSPEYAVCFQLAVNRSIMHRVRIFSFTARQASSVLCHALTASQILDLSIMTWLL